LVGVIDVGDEGHRMSVVAEHERDDGRVLTADHAEGDVVGEEGSSVVEDGRIVVDDHQCYIGTACVLSHGPRMMPQVGDQLCRCCEVAVDASVACG
jgi:hypothetical protein